MPKVLLKGFNQPISVSEEQAEGLRKEMENNNNRSSVTLNGTTMRVSEIKAIVNDGDLGNHADYPYIGADWLSDFPGEWEEGKKRTPLGWMSELEMQKTNVYEWPTSKIGEAQPALQIAVYMASASESGGRLAVSNNFAIWERAKKRCKELGY